MKKYYRRSKETNAMVEITYEKALSICLGTYKDNDMTRDMLSIVNRIDCCYCTIEVEENGMVLMGGLYNTLPMGIEYNEEGNRI